MLHSTSLQLPQSIAIIGSNAFADNEIAELIFAPNSRPMEIGWFAFNNNRLTRVEIPYGITSIQWGVFARNL